jgi:hypothetical protein
MNIGTLEATIDSHSGTDRVSGLVMEGLSSAGSPGEANGTDSLC